MDTTWPVPAPPPAFLGGSREAEGARLAAAEHELIRLQEGLRALSEDGRAGRTFHRMGIAFRATYEPLPAAKLDARLVPEQIRTSLLDPGLRVEEAFARFSHGRGDDNTNALMPDVRGLWVRLYTKGGVQDLTGTNAEVPFFDDPEELLAFGFATRKLVHGLRAGALQAAAGLVRYEAELAAELRRLKPDQFSSSLSAHARAAAMLAGVTRPGLPVHSLAGTQFWSGAPLYIQGTDGRTYAFKYTFRPDAGGGLPSKDLFAELRTRPRVRYGLLIQLYVDDESTPIERPAAWQVPESQVGEVFVETGQPPVDALVDQEASNPSTSLPGVSPAGLNRLRVALYAASARGRGGRPFPEGGLFGGSP